MKNSKTLVIVVIALIAANCVLMCALWYKNYRHEPPPPQGNAFEYLSKELKLTPAQLKQYTVLRDQHFNFTSKVNNEMHMERDSFFDKLSEPSVNTVQVDQLEARILAHQHMLDTATFYHFRKLRAILTPSQQEKFNGVIQNVLHMMARPHGPPGQNPGRPQVEPPPAGVQDGPPQQGPPPNHGRFNGNHRRPGMGRLQGGPPPPPYGRPGGPGRGFGPGGPGGPPPQGPPPDGPPPGPPQ